MNTTKLAYFKRLHLNVVSISISLSLLACQASTPPLHSQTPVGTSTFRTQSVSLGIHNTPLARQIVERNKKKPSTLAFPFEVTTQDLQRRHILSIENGPDTHDRVSSAKIFLNGKEIFQEKNFNQQVSSLNLELENLRAGANKIEVVLNSKPGSAIALQIDSFTLPQNIPGAIHSLIVDTPEVRRFEIVPGKLGIKFLEGMKVRLQTQSDGSQKLVDLNGMPLDSLNAWIEKNGAISVNPAFGGDTSFWDQEEANIEAHMQTEAPNPNLFFHLQFNDSVDVWSLVDTLRKEPYLEEAFPEFVPNEPAVPNDPAVNIDPSTGNYPIFNIGTNKYLKKDWLESTHIMSNAEDAGAWSITNGVPTVKIGMIGTGILHEDIELGLTSANTHEDLKNVQIISNVNKTPTSPPPSWVGVYNQLGHNTAAMGALSATGGNSLGVAGVAFGTTQSLIHDWATVTEYPAPTSRDPLKYSYPASCLGTGTPNCESTADSLYLARKNNLNVAIIEKSIGDCSAFTVEHTNPIVRTAVAASVAYGIHVIVPAGNNRNNDVRKLARSTAVFGLPDTGSIIVGGIKLDGSGRPSAWCDKVIPPATLAYNYGDSQKGGPDNLYTIGGHGVDVTAPADNTVYTTRADNNTPSTINGYAPFSGSSAASPVVTGIVGLLLSKRPDLTPLEVRKALRETRGDKTKPAVVDNTAGMVNAFAVLNRYVPTSTIKAGLFGKFYSSTIHVPLEPYLNTLAQEYPDSKPKPDFAELEPHQPLKTGVFDNIDFGGNSSRDLFETGLKTLYTADLQGTLTIQPGESGEYTFLVGVNSRSGDGALLEIDGEKVIRTYEKSGPANSNNAEDPWYTGVYEGKINLSVGEHSIKVMMYDYPTQPPSFTQADRLILLWKKPGSSGAQPEIIPKEAFSHSQSLEVTARNVKQGLVGRFYAYKSTASRNDPKVILPSDLVFENPKYEYLGSKIFKQLRFKQANEGTIGFDRRGDTFGIGKTDNFLGYFTGFLKLPPGYSPGVYTFHVTHDDGMRLMLDGNEIITRPGPHDATVSQGCGWYDSNPGICRGLWIEQGGVANPNRLHEIAIAYNELGGESELALEWVTPDGKREEVPASAFVH